MTDALRRDLALARACARGERDAQRELYATQRLPLYRMALRYATDPAEAEDFVHDGLLRVFSTIGQYRGTGPLGGWVRRVVVNVILQRLRKRPHLLSTDHLPQESYDPPGFDEEMSGLTGAQLSAFIGDLPAGYRTVFSLYYLEELSHAEIAEQLGISVGASKSQLSKAKAKLRTAIIAKHPQLQYHRK